jgi:hypothetical protein
MNTIYAINADGKETYITVRSSELAKRIKMLQRNGWLNIKVIS